MITSCPQSPQTPKFSLNSLRRGNAPINAVLSKNIPSETLTPLKDLVKYKNNNLNDNNNTNDLGEHLSPETEQCKNEISSLRSTIIAGNLGSDNFSDGSDEKANEHKEATFFPNEEVFKGNKTFDIVTYDSPAKIFQRMKTRAQEASQKQSLKDNISLELQRSQRDVILSPVSLDKTFISGFPDFHKVSSDDHSFSGEPSVSSERKTSSLPSEAPLINFQNKFFLPVKQKIPHQQENQSSHQNLTYDITTSKDRHENISTSVILSEALASSAKLIQDDKNRTTSVEFSLSNTLILESVDADDERSQSPNINGVSVDRVPANTGSQLSKCDSEVPTKGSLEQEMSEENEEKISKTVQQGSASDMFKVLTAAPKTRVVAPEKKVSKISTSVSNTNKNAFTTKKKEICLQKWMIRNMNNNTAVCVEGKLIDTPDLYWHSNAIVERLDYNRLRTISGNVYVLKGTIDTISMKEAGFPASFTRKFIFGFPKNWKQYVDDLLHELRTLPKKGKKCKLDQQETDKSVFDTRMKKSDTSEETGTEMVSKNAKTKNTTFDVSENCSEIPIECNALHRATELKMFHTDQHHEVPLKFRHDEHNCDNQTNITFHTGGKTCLPKEESTSKNESKLITSPKKTKNHEVKTNETIFKSLKRVRKNVAKDTTQELIESSDTQSSREEFLSDTEKMECVNNIKKKLTVMLTPMNSKKTLEQKCKDNNLSTYTIKRISELALPKHKNGGNKADLRKNKNNRLLKSLEKTFGSGLIHKTEDEDDTGIYASVTINQKIKMSSPPKEQSSTSDSERKIKKSLRLNRIEPSGNILPHKIQTKVTEISSQESETEEESRKKAQLGMKTRQKDIKETLINQSKCKRKDTRKRPVILEHESEESDKDIHSKTKKPTSLSNKTAVQKIGNRKKFSSAEVMGSRETKDQPLECFPDLIKEDNWTEKELQKFQGALSSVPKQKHGFWLNVATSVGPRTTEKSQKKHTEEHQGRGSRKRAVKKMVPSPRVSNGTEVDTDTNQPVRITARVGTLKRKQQMRDFLEQLPKDDHDDMFSGSPLHNQRIQLPNFEVSQDDDFPPMDRDPTTPSSVIYPLAKTPQCQHVSPGMLESVNRKDCDKYVFQMQKENKSHGGMVWANVKKKLVGSDFTTPTSRRRTQFNKGMKSDIGKLFSYTTKLNFDEEEQDDYFSNSDSAE
ncbi:mis18-binding protein 1 isoform X2 [Phascolarctos cinereus]|uniref:Mis18-binding protein 1 isoform X1 n=1 Tax=Phascolarctos cinereus TaxID=38626 RepID=A0A6P5KDW5_PHACI|nr:mis18-binding protein 1 isoform X1 [Phascolarctos cinereus]XP_020843724.1 mis18-binding protein 1 isoform X1 [Phascolarctos cinereus]XP_020843735.1 mis18-binding protein 1 isoform X1 [Phascolarctos cinereus]XP_020843743.1 mis18-binding protein 1 isoform X1 [Phascolarctos cinereus]XP_020843756.1 mis18-binding protein 1 isoform X1 [Phascolarctos cinereus]XP_020843765.1 mis18-binding protein 1 isoform X1 [Phascolarctos cinereus]XP_020843775.1 mis18-binding protein 1 isoform X1 [Phascolarctos 